MAEDPSANAPRESAAWPAAASMRMGRAEQLHSQNSRAHPPRTAWTSLDSSSSRATVVSGSTSRTGKRLLVAARRLAAGPASPDPLTRCEARLRAPLFARQLQQAPFLGRSAETTTETASPSTDMLSVAPSTPKTHARSATAQTSPSTGSAHCSPTSSQKRPVAASTPGSTTSPNPSPSRSANKKKKPTPPSPAKKGLRGSSKQPG
jgi:hypothetical protein